MKKSIFIVGILIAVFFLGWIVGNAMKPTIPQEYHTLIAKHCKEYALDPNFVEAIILVESRGKKNAFSGKGASGLMQLMPGTASDIAKELKMKDWDSQKLQNPETNIAMGCHYLHALVRQFEGDLEATAAAYNTGPRRIQKILENRKGEPSIHLIYKFASKETRNFVTWVMREYKTRCTRSKPKIS